MTIRDDEIKAGHVYMSGGGRPVRVVSVAGQHVRAVGTDGVEFGISLRRFAALMDRDLGTRAENVTGGNDA